jgi:hypothetical protein
MAIFLWNGFGFCRILEKQFNLVTILSILAYTPLIDYDTSQFLQLHPWKPWFKSFDLSVFYKLVIGLQIMQLDLYQP